MSRLLPFFQSRLALVQLVALAFAALATFGIVPGIAQEHVVAVALLAFAVVSGLGRLGVAGPIGELDPELGPKHWAQSRIIWAQMIAGIVAVLSLAGVRVDGVDQVQMLEGVMALVALATIVLRPTARPIEQPLA